MSTSGNLAWKAEWALERSAMTAVDKRHLFVVLLLCAALCAPQASAEPLEEDTVASEEEALDLQAPEPEAERDLDDEVPVLPGLQFYRGEALGVPMAASLLGMYRLRAEATPDPQLEGTPNRLLLSHRARLGSAVGVGQHLQMVMQVQDVRYFGQEMSLPGFSGDPTMGSVDAAGLDMREAYLVVQGYGARLTLGRMEVQLDNGRLIAIANFTMHGRSLDGIRFDYSFEGYELTSMWAIEQTAYSPLSPAPDVNRHLGFAYAQLPFTDFFEVRPMNTLEVEFGDGVDAWARWTNGANILTRFMGAYSSTELYYQGTSGSLSRPAFLVGQRVGYTAPVMLNPQLELFVDVLSGSSEGALPTQTFRAVRGLRHVFYGWHDMFRNMPVDTKDRGLIDGGLRAALNQGSLYVDSRLHMFSAAVWDGLDAPQRSMFGIEPNLIAGYRPYNWLDLSVLATAFFPVGTGLARGPAPYSSWLIFQVELKL